MIMVPVKTNVFSYVKKCEDRKPIEGNAWWDAHRIGTDDVIKFVYNTVNIEIWNKVYFGSN